MYLRPGRDAFRVVAPSTVQGTPFKKNGRAYTRAVLSGQPLRVQDNGPLSAGGVRSRPLDIQLKGRFPVRFHRGKLHPVAFAGDDFVLQLPADRSEVGIITGNAHQQMAVVLGVLLSVTQDIGVYHIYLQCASAVLRIAA